MATAEIIVDTAPIRAALGEVEEACKAVEAAWRSLPVAIRKGAPVCIMLGEGVEGLDFGDALHALKAGKRVRRSGWNGKGMWLALTEGSAITLPPSAPGSLRGAAVLRAEEMENEPAEADGIYRLRIGAHIDMRAADGSLVIGWPASQTDMLATDWQVIE